MFSRFDNMMQHTRTHGPKKNDPSSKGESAPVSVPEDNSLIYVPVRSPQENQGSSPQMYYRRPSSSDDLISPKLEQEDDDVKYQLYCNKSSHEQQRYSDYYSPNSPPQFHEFVITSSPKQSMASYSHHSACYPPRSPSNYVQRTVDDYGNYSQKQKQHYYGGKRRLSYIELASPIQQLGTEPCAMSETTTDDDEDERRMSPLSVHEDRIKVEGIDVTVDEFEALQGFSKFCTEPVVRDRMLTNSPSCSSDPFPVHLPPLKYDKAVLSNDPKLTFQVSASGQENPIFQV